MSQHLPPLEAVMASGKGGVWDMLFIHAVPQGPHALDSTYGEISFFLLCAPTACCISLFIIRIAFVMSRLVSIFPRNYKVLERRDCVYVSFS